MRAEELVQLKTPIRTVGKAVKAESSKEPAPGAAKSASVNEEVAKAESGVSLVERAFKHQMRM